MESEEKEMEQCEYYGTMCDGNPSVRDKTLYCESKSRSEGCTKRKDLERRLNLYLGGKRDGSCRE